MCGTISTATHIPQSTLVALGEAVPTTSVSPTESRTRSLQHGRDHCASLTAETNYARKRATCDEMDLMSVACSPHHGCPNVDHHRIHRVQHPYSDGSCACNRPRLIFSSMQMLAAEFSGLRLSATPAPTLTPFSRPPSACRIRAGCHGPRRQIYGCCCATTDLNRRRIARSAAVSPPKIPRMESSDPRLRAWRLRSTCLTRKSPLRLQASLVPSRSKGRLTRSPTPGILGHDTVSRPQLRNQTCIGRIRWCPARQNSPSKLICRSQRVMQSAELSQMDGSSFLKSKPRYQTLLPSFRRPRRNQPMFSQGARTSPTKTAAKCELNSQSMAALHF